VGEGATPSRDDSTPIHSSSRSFFVSSLATRIAGVVDGSPGRRHGLLVERDRHAAERARQIAVFERLRDPSQTNRFRERKVLAFHARNICDAIESAPFVKPYIAW